MKDKPRRWITLSAAAKLLGVHPATLRHWADAGEVPSYRTPGGHRRFDADDLHAFLLRASTGSEQALDTDQESMLESALVQTRTELRRSPPSQDAWFNAFDDEGRERQRRLGRNLFEYTVQYVTLPRKRPELLQKGWELGAAYAEGSLRYNISLIDTVRAFQYFRQNLLQALTAGDEEKEIFDKEDLRLRQDIDTYLNEVLYGLIDAYEQKLLGRALLERHQDDPA